MSKLLPLSVKDILYTHYLEEKALNINAIRSSH